jgi:hypothetical protein
MSTANLQSRRNLLTLGATLGAAMTLPPSMASAAAVSQAGAASRASGDPDLPVISDKRTLGRGRFAMPVSALGFGVMGMDHDRGPHPDRAAMIALLHRSSRPRRHIVRHRGGLWLVLSV